MQERSSGPTWCRSSPCASWWVPRCCGPSPAAARPRRARCATGWRREPACSSATCSRPPGCATTAATSAFITYLLVVIVPLIGVVRTRRPPPANVVVGVVLAVAGLGLLSSGVSGIGQGEVLTMGAALAFAVHLVVLGEVSGRHDPIRLTFWQVLTVGAACLVPGAASGGGYGFDRGVWVAAAFCGVAATALAFWCMAWGQRVVPESQAAIILLLEPVSARILGELAGDHLGPVGLAGAALILAAVVVAGGPAQATALGAELAVVLPNADRLAATAHPPGWAWQPLRMSEATPGPAVVIPAGPPILEAAAWVGHACWAELRFHQVLTTWLAVEADLELSQAFWAIRGHRAQVAEWWHRRLPELREHPAARSSRRAAPTWPSGSTSSTSSCSPTPAWTGPWLPPASWWPSAEATKNAGPWPWAPPTDPWRPPSCRRWPSPSRTTRPSRGAGGAAGALP
ncbi:MAG: DMT family transporter [Acidimicrobiales bacterium]